MFAGRSLRLAGFAGSLAVRCLFAGRSYPQAVRWQFAEFRTSVAVCRLLAGRSLAVLRLFTGRPLGFRCVRWLFADCQLAALLAVLSAFVWDGPLTLVGTAQLSVHD